MDVFDIRSYTIPKVGKEKNGDSYIVEYLEEEKLLLAVVADGVSRQPCDWLASETTCQKLMENFRAMTEQPGISTRLKSSILETNRYFLAIEGNCRKMASTLSAVAWDVACNLIYYANIGDSRIYSLTGGTLEQLTKDDSVISKEKVFMHGGARVIDKITLTKVIGQDNISVTIVERPVGSGEIIMLASDGFYDARKASFGKIMSQFWKTEDFGENFNMIIDSLEMLRGDDFTVVMIRRSNR